MCGLVTSARATTYTVTDFSGLAGVSDVLATGINDSGDIVGSYPVGSLPYVSAYQDFLYSDGHTTLLTAPTATPYGPIRINNLGQIAGSLGKSEAWVYDHGTYTPVNLFLNPELIGLPTIGGINNLGQVTAQETLDPSEVEGETLISVGDLRNPYGGRNIAVPSFLEGQHGGTLVSVIRADIGGINDLGQFVGTYFNGTRTVPFVGDLSGNLTPIQTDGLPDPNPNPIAINNVGQIVAATNILNGFPGTVVLNPDGTYSLISIPGARIVYPEAINDLGTVVGWYSMAGEENTVAFIASPTISATPEPSALFLFSLGLGVLGWTQRRCTAKNSGRETSRRDHGSQGLSRN